MESIFGYLFSSFLWEFRIFRKKVLHSRRPGVRVSRFEYFVAFRYLLTKKKTGFISFISVISIVGIAIGVAALIIVLSLMNGFTKEIRTRVVGMDGHIYVTYPLENGAIPDYEDVRTKLSGIEGVTGIAAYCNYETVMSTTQRHSRPVYVQVRGAEEETIDSVTEIKDFVRLGSFDLGPGEDGVPGMVIGNYVWRQLSNPMIGEYVIVYGQVDMDSAFEDFTMPAYHKFRIAGIFNSGFYDYDSTVAIIDIGEAQKILGLEDMATEIGMRIEHMFKVDQYTREGGYIDEVLGGPPYFSTSWIEKNITLFKWMKLEKWAAFIVLSLIVLVAAFNIVSTLIMLVMDKTREVGILKSMGATNKSIERIFVYQGAFVGICGTILGSVLGTLLCVIQDHYRIISFPPDIYFISALPVELLARDVVSITLVALLLCWISSYYPARKAAKLTPVDAIRSE